MKWWFLLFAPFGHGLQGGRDGLHHATLRGGLRDTPILQTKNILFRNICLVFVINFSVWDFTWRGPICRRARFRVSPCGWEWRGGPWAEQKKCVLRWCAWGWRFCRIVARTVWVVCFVLENRAAAAGMWFFQKAVQPCAAIKCAKGFYRFICICPFVRSANIHPHATKPVTSMFLHSPF